MNPLNLFRKKPKSRSGEHRAHMTWASTRIGRTVTQTGVLLRGNLWIWPIVAVVLLSIVGFSVRNAVQSTMEENLRSELQTLLNLEKVMLETWLKSQCSNAETLASGLNVREQVYALLGLDNSGQQELEQPLQAEGVQKQLHRLLAPALSSHNYCGYVVTDKSKKIIASSYPALIGTEVAEYDSFLSASLDGETTVCPPFPSVNMIRDKQGVQKVGVPIMYVSSPVRDASFQVVATLALQIRPEDEFTRILQFGQLGRSGETYAFNREGVMVSNSRFDDDLMLLGLLPDQPGSHSILNLSLRDPQGNIVTGYRPTVHRAELPLTRMAADAIAGNAAVDVGGYRDYRGVPVVGAWAWMDGFEIGVATEMDFDEAFLPLTILQRVFWSMMALLGVSAVAIFVFTIMVSRLQREAQKAAIEAKKIGQYQLERKLGAGAMGVVYRGKHALLQRATAIKMLDVDKINDASIKRFEREVQITCQLNHPNTVAIYDYGRTPEGVFYYAMEFLDGIDLQRLVEEDGPQSERRVIHILRQVCGSLYEAHALGLVHRDIKPANIMLNWRGGEPDVVKVLDFGLVKAVDEKKEANLTSANSLLGTPLYMAPESIQSPDTVDARSDIYAVGAVGYYLLTGRPVFDASSIIELCQKHIAEIPRHPSELAGEEFSRELDFAILSCLEKSPAKRPQTARDLAQLLARSPEAGAWSFDDADAWWNRHERKQAGPKPGLATQTAQAQNTRQDQLGHTGEWETSIS